MLEEYDYDLPKRKRKPPKRYLPSDDENAPHPVPPKAPRRNSATRPRRKSSAADSVDFDAVDEANDVDMAVDIEGLDDEDEELLAAASVGTSQSQSQSKSKTLRIKVGGASKGSLDGPPARKKPRKVVVSDEEEADDYMADGVVQEEEEPSDQDYYSEEEKPKKGKSSAGGRGTKRKAKAEAESSVARPSLERKLSSLDTRNLKKGKASLKTDDSLSSLLDFGESAPTPDPSEKLSPSGALPGVDSPAPATVSTPSVSVPPKKPKLPTIKKNKLPGSGAATGGTSTPTSATSKTKLPLDLGIGSNRKTHTATTDLDLSNKSIYQELFKTGNDSGTLRTGLNRRSKEEERRKELNKQREDYLAKQAEEATHSFDLQAATDKIFQFEERLRTMKSAALYPQFLGAKWKQIYGNNLDREQRKQKEHAQPPPVAAEGGGYPDAQEEGEV